MKKLSKLLLLTLMCTGFTASFAFNANAAEITESSIEPEAEIETSSDDAIINEDEIISTNSDSTENKIIEDVIAFEGINEDTGDFTLRISGGIVSDSSDTVVVPTWSKSDQSDMVWYAAEKVGNDYYVYGNIANHKYSFGTYIAHVYVSGASGMNFMGGTSFECNASGRVDAALQADGGTVDLATEELKEYGAFSAVQYAVWSDVNGQDDLKWYIVPKSNDANAYQKTISLSDHKGTGTYYVHCYAITKKSSLVFIGATNFEVESASASSIEVSDIDSATGKFTVKISGVNAPSGIKSVCVPVWCDDNQNDIYWYQAIKQGDSYVASCSLSNHKYHIGTYKLDAYLTNNSGSMEFLGRVFAEAKMSYEELKITDIAGNEKQFDIKLTGLNSYGDNLEVVYAVWSDVNGQDDLKWYDAGKIGSVYDKIISIADHKSGGKYYVHCYVRNSSGQFVFLCGNEFSISEPVAENINFSADKETGTLELDVAEVKSNSGVKKVEAYIWGKEDKSDIKKYTLTKSGDEYKTVTNISYFKYYNGTYSANILVTDGNDIVSDVGTATVDINFEKGEISVESNVSEIYYPISLKNCDFCGGDEELQFAVWSDKDGQDDLVWYKANKVNGVYTANMNITNHMTAGLYYIHAYVILKDGSMQFVTSYTFDMGELPKDSIKIVNVDESAGTFDVIFNVIRKESTIRSVTIPVWCASDQSDLVWYQADRQSDGSYKTTVNIANHNMHSGNYIVHAYVNGTDGSFEFVSAASQEFYCRNYVAVNKVGISLVEITVYNPTVNGTPAVSVSFPTWSLEGDQDDLVWYTGTKNEDGSFSATIERSSHSHNGEYITDIYVSDGSVQTVIKRCDYELGFSNVYDSYAASVMRNIIYALETGGQIYGNNRYDAFTMAYNVSCNERAITIGAGQWYGVNAKELLNAIRDEDFEAFARNDTAGIGDDLDSADWSIYGSDGTVLTQSNFKSQGENHRTIKSGSAKALAIQNIIKSDAGIAVQDRFLDAQMTQYVNEAAELGVTDLKAKMFCANIRHLGGSGALKRIINNCKNDGLALTMNNLWITMQKDQNDTSSNTQVGDTLYQKRHIKVMSWINKYLGE